MTKEAFIESELLILAWSAAVQHNKIYSTNNQNLRNKFKDFLLAFIEKEVIPQYLNDVSEEIHYENIKKISKKSQEYKANEDVISKFNIGTAQKLLNMLLKYYWCLGKIKITPPHFPLDRIMLKKIGVRNKNWTDIETMEEYSEYIKKAKDFSNANHYANIAEMELAVYKRS